MNDGPSAGRRLVLKGLAGFGAVGVAGGAARLIPGPADSDGGGVGGLVLSSHETPGMGTLEVPIGPTLVRRTGPAQWRSQRLSTSTYTMAAFIWSAQSQEKPTFRIRSQGATGWSAWAAVPPLHGGAADTGQEAATHTGTELVWVGRSDGIHIEVNGVRPPQLALVLLHPLRRKSDTMLPSPPAAPTAPDVDQDVLAAQELALLKPQILTRAAWGADERWRTNAPEFNHVMQQVHIHHTASGNDYSAAVVPALLRGFYRYHTHNLGWSDIGYNFLVDRFGRIWEGRAGGVDRAVQGAHTRGFNTTSAGVAVIGNFDQVAPNEKILDGLAAVVAWKVDSFSGNPTGKATVISEGSDKYRARERVALPVIDGHRDTNDTACPGRHLYAAIPSVREQVKTRIATAWAATHPVVVVKPPKLLGNARIGEALTVTPGTFDPENAKVTYSWVRDGAPIAGATLASYTCVPTDLGVQLSVMVTAAKDPRAAVTQVLTAPSRTTGVPTLRIKTMSRRRGRAGIRVRVLPPAGVEQVATGRVTIEIGDDIQRIDLVDGLARAAFRALPAGVNDVKVRFEGGGGLEAARATWSVRVR